MPCGPTCVCLEEPGIECLSVVDPDRFGYFADWCSSGDPVKRRHVLNRSRAGLTPDPHPTRPSAVPAVPPSVPMAGDIVAAMTARIGLDRLTKYVADKLGVDCGCPERRAKLNRLDAAVRRFLSRKV